MKVIDGTNMILGRFASNIAKMLLNNEQIVVVNTEKILIVGNPKSIFYDFKKLREIGDKRKGPYYPRTPHNIFKRAVRGMLPYQQPKGRKALKNLKVYIGVPDEYKNSNMEKISQKELTYKFITLDDISKRLGAK